MVDCFRSGVVEKNCCLAILKALYGVVVTFVVHRAQVHGLLAALSALENNVGGGLIVALVQ